tara:strand:+ start:1013 stop:2227 length:1215 start_codon:yes stop_codon:yes gene_type:complete
MSRCRILHVINNLHLGGAETMLLRLLGRLDRSRWDPHVVSLIGGGPVAEQLRQLGVPVIEVGMRRGIPGPMTLVRLIRCVGQVGPDLVQTWLYHSDLLGGLATRMSQSRAPVVWTLRMNGPTPALDKATTVWTARACAALSSRLPARIVANSQAGLQRHVELGYDASRCQVIPNGFETDVFQPSEEARGLIRGELGVHGKCELVGMAARWDPLKDFDTLLRSAAHWISTRPDCHVVLCGPGVTRDNTDLTRLVAAVNGPSVRHDWSSKLHLLGRRSDMPTWQASLDVAVLASRTEGFPNALGEAMSCGVPCVATDAGGTSEVLGPTGRLVPVGDVDALTGAVNACLDAGRDARIQEGLSARRQIENHLGLDRMVERFEAVWDDVLGDRLRAGVTKSGTAQKRAA